MFRLRDGCCRSATGPGVSRISGLLIIPGMILVECLVMGCGGSPPAPRQEAAPVAAAKPASSAPRTAASDRPGSTSRKKKQSDIPYDAYFDNPLEVVASNTGVVAPANTPTEPATSTAANPTVAETPAATSDGSVAWAEFLPIENLQGEIKKVQNQLKACMVSPGTYNGTYQDVVVYGSVIAAMAEIAIEHSEAVSWKDNAPLIRDTGLELSQAAIGLGKANYEKTKTAYDKLESIFAGSIPADVPEAAPRRPFDETAGRGGLMKRIEKARNHLRDNINVEAKLKAEADSVLHETLIIATLGKVVCTDSYSSSDEDDYKNFGKALIDGAREATAAVKDQSFQKFTESMNKVNKSCDQCHAIYGNG